MAAAPVDTSSGKHAGTVSLQGGADEKKESLPTYFGVLQVTAAEAKGLKDTQKLGKQDPYCSVSLNKRRMCPDVPDRVCVRADPSGQAEMADASTPGRQ